MSKINFGTCRKIIFLIIAAISLLSMASCTNNGSSVVDSSAPSDSAADINSAGISASLQDGTTSEAVNSYTAALKDILNSPQKTAVAVNGEPIYDSDIKAAALFQEYELSKNINILKGDASFNEEEYLKQYKKSEADITDELIKQRVLAEAAQAAGIEVAMSDAESEAKTAWEIVIKNEPYYAQKLFDAYGTDSAGYIKTVAAPAQQQFMLAQKYEEYFVEKSSDKNDREKLKAEYLSHIDDLIKKADIKYYD